MPQALVLIHGFPLDRHLWDAQLEGLSSLTRVIAPDLRGAGDSEVPPGPYSVDQYADDVAGLLDGLNIRRAVIGGLSMGGYVAFAFWRRYAERVRALVLCDTRADPDSAEGKANRDAAMQRVRSDGAEAFAREQAQRLLAPASLENVRLAGRALAMMAAVPVEGTVGALHALRDRPDSRPALPSIDVPTLVLVGAEDKVTPPDVARELAGSIRNSRLAIIPGAGHLSPMEQPRAVNRALRVFLTNLPN
jgi:pimeloyl-ACP methyl ester carboxylesterase